MQVSQKAVILSHGKILMVRKSLQAPAYPGHWEFPGGRLEQGESLDEGIRREVREETGLEIVAGKPLSLWQFDLQGRTVVGITRLCEVIGGFVTFTGQDEGDHIDAARWYKPEEIPSLQLIPDSVASTMEALKNIY